MAPAARTARYAADRARRQYQLAEPENRLVAQALETDWEAALAEAGRLEADYQRFTEELPKTLTAAERAAIGSGDGDHGPPVQEQVVPAVDEPGRGQRGQLVRQ